MFSAFYDDIFHGDSKEGYAEVDVATPSGDVVHRVVHVERGAPALETIWRIAIPLLAFLSVAAYVGRISLTHKVWKGAVACMCAALIVLAVLRFAVARRLDLGYVPGAMTVAAWIAVSLSIGAASAWVAAVWWPNKALERTRER